MMVSAALPGIALLLAGVADAGGAPPPPDAADIVPSLAFAPPVGEAMTYRVTTRQIGGNGSLARFSLVHRLEWHRAGRGFELIATLEAVESDAPPAAARAVSGVLQPLVGEGVRYVIAADGRRVDLVDPDGLWERVTARAIALGEGDGRAESRQMAALLAALPPHQREEMATAEIRALFAALNGRLPMAGPGVSVRQLDGRRIVAKLDRDTLPAAAGGKSRRPIEVATTWEVDTATGLVVKEQRQTWLIEPGGARSLVEERVRAIEPEK